QCVDTSSRAIAVRFSRYATVVGQAVAETEEARKSARLRPAIAIAEHEEAGRRQQDRDSSFHPLSPRFCYSAGVGWRSAVRFREREPFVRTGTRRWLKFSQSARKCCENATVDVPALF